MTAPTGIWKTDTASRREGDSIVFSSSRCGGPYKLSGSVLAQIEDITDTDRVRLTEAIWRLRPIPIANEVWIDSNFFYSARNIQLPSYRERYSRGLRTLLHLFPEIGVSITVLPEPAPDTLTLLGATLSKTLGELKAFFDEYEREGKLLSTHKPGSSFKKYTIPISTFVESESHPANLSRNTAFVAMWFNSEMNGAFLSGIDPAIREAGYEPLRIDQKEHNNRIDDEIIAAIRSCRFVVADFTSEPEKPRGGVYYEAGFAQGLGLPVIWMCREDLIGQVHFDTRQYNHITWNSPQDLKTKLYNRIVATIGVGAIRRT